MSSSAPKRRLDVRQETPKRTTSGKRVAARRGAKKRSFRLTPAMAGAFALILAGFGSAVVSGHVDSSTLSASNYQTISETYTGDDINGVEVSRAYDRNLDKQGTNVQLVQLGSLEMANPVFPFEILRGPERASRHRGIEDVLRHYVFFSLQTCWGGCCTPEQGACHTLNGGEE